MSLALTGQRVALFNTNVLSCNSNYFGYKTDNLTFIFSHWLWFIIIHNK